MRGELRMRPVLAVAALSVGSASAQEILSSTFGNGGGNGNRSVGHAQCGRRPDRRGGRWRARDGGGELEPRRAQTASPHALYAEHAGGGRNLEADGDLYVGGGEEDYDNQAETVGIRGRSDTWYLNVANTAKAAAADFFIGKSATGDGGLSPRPPRFRHWAVAATVDASAVEEELASLRLSCCMTKPTM
jgi:hypothetical protein